MEQISNFEKSQLRTTALKMSRDLNPNKNSGQYAVMSTSPSVDIVLKDAQKIYEWLLEGESNFEAGKR